MQKSQFEIQKMDCPSEENLIRLKLQGEESIIKLEFNIPLRQLFVYHSDGLESITQGLDSLRLGSNLLQSERVENFEIQEDKSQKRVLWIVLALNFSFFLVEFVGGLFSKSMGLLADSLDMLADAFVYGMSIMVVGKSRIKKKLVARLSGYIQISLALLGLLELVRRFFWTNENPDYKTMIVLSILALITNGICLNLLSKGNNEDAHMKASMIFTSNDIIINAGVIFAGLLVLWLESPFPDLIIGLLVFIIVLRGGFRILKLAK